jgi:hypothetical protein
MTKGLGLSKRDAAGDLSLLELREENAEVLFSSETSGSVPLERTL